MKKPSADSSLPAHYRSFGDRYPEVAEAYAKLGQVLRAAGPLDPKTVALIKLSTAAAMRSEGAVHSHTRRALDAGCSPGEIRQAVILTLTTIGFPAMMAALSWTEDILAQ
ncbi:MAG: carboxymuconolactone decarboxylase family protein [Puniceicoccaceae bacterium]|nr:MAG: carboxymuconolactone decarboxylase family protein [Puniceicoccaceae bacterium]